MFLCGAGGHAKVVIEILEANHVCIEGIFETDETITTVFDYPVFHTSELKGPLIICIGNNQKRKIISSSVNIEFGQAIHPSATVSKRANIGVGTVIMQGAIIQAYAEIGKHCIINTGSSLDHECVVNDFVHISPHATLCGNVKVGEGSWIGAGATILPGVRIGQWSIVGAGSVVTSNIPDNVVAYGSPCKIIRKT